MNNGWIKLHRKLIDKGFFKRPQYLVLWIYLLLTANHAEKEFMWNGNTIIVKEGQLITGRKELAKQTGISETTIERILNYLESEHQIGQQKTTKYRLITIINWSEYQKVDSTSDNKRTTNGQQTDTNKNDKKNKNEKKYIADSKTDVLQEDKVVKYNPLGAEIIKALEEVDPKNKTYYGNKTQREACDFLIQEYGLYQVLKRVSVLSKTNKIQYFPTITTPVQLKDKWVQLQDAVDRKRGEIKSKHKIAFS